MELDDIVRKLRDSGNNKVKLAVSDIDGILRGKIIHIDKLEELQGRHLGFCNVVFGWDSSDSCYDNSIFTGWHTGYPDAPVTLDASTFRRIPWDGDTPFLLGDYGGDTNNGMYICPRSLMKRIAGQCYESGFVPLFAQEFEWNNFLETPRELADRDYHNPTPLTPGMFGYSILRPSMHQEYFNALFEWLDAFDVRLEGLHTETGPGIYEAAIRYDEVLRAADKALLFKSSVKEIAHKFGITASFMAKWNENLPGCGGHIHQSLWDREKKRNMFYDPGDKNRMSKIMKHYLAGQLMCLPYILPMYAPTINSYKRLREGAWAPTNITWGIDNRTTAIRVINPYESACRIEMRVPGSDTNPYLALSASLASGLYGIKHKLELDMASTTGNGYSDANPVLTRTLEEATQAMKESDLARELFGADFVDHFSRTREWEIRKYSQHISDWELKRYLEII